ncbi:unnamed protein product [Leptidea sinapis]|uniref:Uncharacterized protein n=1 Tax=Leptidea sinapis TaxID=189913 RepID=A0A5E4QW33_9NEOP|nr:unnamed protein product [Leptidea sinapis]
MLAALLYHTGLKEHALATAITEMEKGEVKLSPAMSEIVKAVQQSKWTLMRTRQQLSRGYKEVCAAPLERARFLLHDVRAAISPAVSALESRPPSRRPPTAKKMFRKVMKMSKSPTFYKCIDTTTKELRNRQNSFSKSMMKATGSLLQGDALLIKSTIASQSSKTVEEMPSIIEPICDATKKFKSKINIKPKEKPHYKDLKNAINSDDMRNEGKDVKENEKGATSDKDIDDKTPTNELSISSINDFTDNSVLKESMESEKQVKSLADDLKNELILANEEKDDDSSERNKFVNAWVSRLACEEKDLYWMLEDVTSEQRSLITAIIDFVMTEETCDIDILKRAMYCQVQRAEMRRNGYSIINSIINSSQTMSDSIKYAAFSGVMGARYADSVPHIQLHPVMPLTKPLQGIESVIPYLKYMVLLEKSKLMDFILIELKARVLEGEQIQPLPLKMSANYGAHALLNRPSRASGGLEWRRTVSAQLTALAGRGWLETHAADPALACPAHSAADEEELAGALGVVGGMEWRIRIGQRVSVGSPPRHAVVTQFSSRAKITLVHDDNTMTKTELTNVENIECEKLSHPLGGASTGVCGESALRVCAALLGAGPVTSPLHQHHLPAEVDVYGLRRQQMELLTLCAVRGLLTTRTRLRKVLMQPPDNVARDDKEYESSPEMPLIDRSNVMQMSMGPSTSTASLSRKDLNTWANSAQVQQVIEMGFSRHAVYSAIRTLGM